MDLWETDNHMRAGALPNFGRRLRRLRLLRGLKQGVIAELAGVTQATVSRWERGELEPESKLATALLSKIAGNTPNLTDSALKRVVESAALSAHLIVDTDHRLLAASASREVEWGRSATALLGQPLWRFATPSIRDAEHRLDAFGWWQDQVPAPLEVATEDGDGGLRIKAGLMLWEKLYLSDGTPVRLCTDVSDGWSRA